MRDRDLDAEPDRLRSGRPWTGRMVLFTLLGFFGLVFAANGVLVHEALSTLTGVDTDSAYQAGRRYEREVAHAKAQDARQWRVDAKVTPTADGARLDITARDAAGRLLPGLDASALFERPTDRRLDQDVSLAADGAGRFHGDAALAAGQWDLVIEFSRQGEQLFRSRNRVMLP
ncbi:MAG TPA: FixH family protein [Xanthobacteraceae bacterium]|nr:FixH family protein [Xanthobacteraceae bacterium]